MLGQRLLRNLSVLAILVSGTFGGGSTLGVARAQPACGRCPLPTRTAGAWSLHTHPEGEP